MAELSYKDQQDLKTLKRFVNIYRFCQDSAVNISDL